MCAACGRTKPAQIVGFRYFNVYGPREQHKGRMASVAYHFFNQYQAEGKVKLFEGCDGYANGEQRRDFVSVEDVVKVNLWFLDHPDQSGIFNLGTGHSQTFNDVAVAAVNACRKAKGEAPLNLEEMQAQGLIEYVTFPGGAQGQIPELHPGGHFRPARCRLRRPVPDRGTGRGALCGASA